MCIYFYIGQWDSWQQGTVLQNRLGAFLLLKLKASYTCKCLFKEKLGFLKGRVAHILICLHFYTNFLLWIVFHAVNFKYQLRWKIRLYFPLYRFFPGLNICIKPLKSKQIKILKFIRAVCNANKENRILEVIVWLTVMICWKWDTGFHRTSVDASLTFRLDSNFQPIFK